MLTDKTLQHASRNTGGLIDHAEDYFNAAHQQGLMALYARPRAARQVDIVFDGFPSQRITDFVRCSYLGLDNHPLVIDGAIKAIEEYRALHWSCARTRLNFAILRDLENSLSDLFQARVITYTTVLAANMGALPIVASGHLTGGIRPMMAFDRHAHATLAFHKGTIALETQVRTLAHNDLDALEELCRSNRAVAYVCDGVYSMGGNAPIRDLRYLQDRYGLFLYIDDAHGVSICGKNGEGFVRSQYGNELGERTIIAASLGKGFGASGGMLMLGTARQEELFRRFAVAHAFSASLNVAAIGAVSGSLTIHRSDELLRRQLALSSNIELLDSMLVTEQSGAPLPIRTVNLGTEERAVNGTRALLDRGIYGSAIFFPTVAKGKAGIRVCVTSDHTPEEITGLCAALSEIMDDQAIS